MPTQQSSKKNSTGLSITIRVELNNRVGSFAKLAGIIQECHGMLGGIDLVKVENNFSTRDITIDMPGEEEIENLKNLIAENDSLELVGISDRTFLMHLGGKIEITSKFPLKTRDDLSRAYTPGVARVCMAIHEDISKSKSLTIKKNTIAIISDGTAVLGLGDIGPEAALPVMEGKAMLFKEFGDVNAFPLCLATKDVDEIVRTVQLLEPNIGGVNLEDISAPRCFEIERRLKETMSVPVFHDDQHGTAIVLTAGLINSLKLIGKKAEDIKVVIAGVGAAGTACTQMMLQLGVKNVIGLDRKGSLDSTRTDLNESKIDFLKMSNPHDEKGELSDIIKGADVFIGVSGPDILKVSDLKLMAKDAIVFAMSNPVPEIMPEDAWPHVRIMATGRSDYPNQINNVLCFPGLFRGLLDAKAIDISDETKMAAAIAIASCVDENALSEEYIIPSVFDKNVAKSVAQAVMETC
jgi:malate dehydrogenase (oxaloacetate-decarboxylating)